MTTRDLDQTERDTLERMIDTTSVAAVLEALSEICGEKAEHIDEVWQDRGLSKRWRTAEGQIGVASTKLPMIPGLGI